MVSMLARANRMTTKADFITTVRKGRRAHVGALTGFLLTSQNQSGQTQPPKFGFQVSRRVGGSVDRHRVVRQLRHLVAPWVPITPDSTMVVIRPNEKSKDFSQDLDLLMKQLTKSPGGRK